VVLAAAGVTLLAPGDVRRGYDDPRATSYRAGPHGALAAYLLLGELGHRVERRVHPLVSVERLPSTLILLTPAQRLSPRELDVLEEWVVEGGTLLYAAGPGDTLAVELGLVLDRAASAVARRSGDHPYLEGTDSVIGFRRVFADSSRALAGKGAIALLRGAEGGVAAVVLPFGEGTVVAWSDAAPLTNGWLRTSGAALPFARIVADLTPPAERVVFDEFHHGFRGEGSPAQAVAAFVRERPAGRMTLQLLVVGLGLLWLAGRRLGSPYPPLPVRRRSPVEHLFALAEAYHRGGAHASARRLLVVGLARRFGRRPPAAGGEEAFLERLAAHPAAIQADARELLEEWRKGSTSDLVTMARLSDRLILEAKRS
jgi:hypothetical protein